MPTFPSLPSALAAQARTLRLAGVPALVAHPDWSRPAPLMIWMHGRTVNKEIDPGRYLRWIRAGIAACALDLPGHGERAEPQRQSPTGTLGVIRQMVAELDAVLDALARSPLAPLLDFTRLGLGGMSLGGMCALRRLCDPHPFTAAAVECTTGDLGRLYHPPPGETAWPVRHAPEAVAPIDPMQNLRHWRPIPLLVLHGVADRVVPIAGQRGFVHALRTHHSNLGAPADQVEMVEFPENGAPDEHAGFGRLGHDAKSAQTAFLRRVLGA